MFDFTFELTDEELQSVSGSLGYAAAGTGALGVGGCGIGATGVYEAGIPTLGLGIGVPALGGCAATTGPYVYAHTHSATSALAYTTSLRQSQAVHHSEFTMIG